MGSGQGNLGSRLVRGVAKDFLWLTVNDLGYSVVCGGLKVCLLYGFLTLQVQFRASGSGIMGIMQNAEQSTLSMYVKSPKYKDVPIMAYYAARRMLNTRGWAILM